ncbi:MAG TPA: putative baseplate assembly protein [Actinomycetota bacterium]
MAGRVGLDYVEVAEDAPLLYAYFLGDLPPELAENKPGIERYLRVEGGERIRDLRILDVDPVVPPGEEQDPYLVVRLDRGGDFSTYTLRLVGVEGTDPRYDHAGFRFHIDCPRDLDCLPACVCEPATPPEPAIDYLAKDYQSFRRLILDRLAVLMPQWTERHVPDLGIALVELLAYTADYLSYYQDAAATEAYLDTARQRISVRRHVRLVDYALHEGCNARTWVCVDVSQDLSLDPAEMSFVTGLEALATLPAVVGWEDLSEIPPGAYEVFEPMRKYGAKPIELRQAHNEIAFYTWGDAQCCLERGATSAALLDAWVAAPSEGPKEARQEGDEDGGARMLALAPGDVLIFEEVISPKTGLAADADLTRHHAVRLIRVTPGEDPVTPTADGRPTPYVEIEWGAQDAPPFTFCISAIGSSPGCPYLTNVSVARGNVVLADHGRTVGPDDLRCVPVLRTEAVCECAGEPGDVRTIPGPYQPHLTRTPLTFRQPLHADRSFAKRWVPAAALLGQDVHAALPQVDLASAPPKRWRPRIDLLASRPGDHDFVAEIDNDGVAHLRFGDGDAGAAPEAGMHFSATYRTGNGTAGNVGAEALSHLVLAHTRLEGVSVSIRNPLPATGGTDPEPVPDAKLFAPHLFRKRIERAITADDYAEIAGRNPALQRASAALVWTGSWYEAVVAADPLGREQADERLLREIEGYLWRFRRMGHDLRTVPARYVAVDLGLDVCVKPHFQRGHVKAALLDAFSNRVLVGGRLGFFHPDNLTFGQSIFVSRIVAAAQAVPGVACATVTRLQRRFEPPNHEIETGVLPIRSWEIAQLDNDGNHPERGRLDVSVSGGL